MSQHLKWRPVEPHGRGSFGVAMKNLIIERFGYEAVVDESHRGFLEGLAAAKAGELSDDATTILDLIDKHGSICLFVS